MTFREGITLDQLNTWGTNTMTEHLGIRITKIGSDTLTATMPVDHRTKQPLGLLHGGANVVLAETLGSVQET
ncbi:acyl-CoA esterase [Nitritalea halalkaliphila LW7]|uniref:Acyl-CoA esterase n=1 Tax=Nitritalea halalkaliphila LW7 TaxID=1189621 RepID=I5BT98_9BACT|nr:acyl-CoA esterase [Nitritalea halalkaliphila LW7]